ncbi:KH domain-containing protein [Thermococcus sp.]|uniref:KH domain-containing protein n=1 Tax=Thermococcus sp. TaxID=35749 RepID=UPI0026036172|nr:KH domain-containing protein [Thermococcus sp.]
MKDRLERMLNVKILDMEELEDRVIVYVPEDQVRIAVGSGGAAVKAAELVIGKKIEVRGK